MVVTWEVSGSGGRYQHRRSFWSGVLCMVFKLSGSVFGAIVHGHCSCTSSSKALKREGVLGFNEVLFDVSRSLVVESIVIALNAKAAQEEDLYDSSWQSEKTLKYYLGNVLCVRIAYAWNFGGSWRLPSEIALVFVEFKQELVL